MPEPPRQDLANLEGEVRFRAKLARQHGAEGVVLLPDYPDKAEHDRILADRVATTRATFAALAGRRIRFDRYLELGAERGHRALVLENEFGAHGIAADLSLEQLRTLPHFAALFGLPKLPVRVCCDAARLPVRTGVVPFVFCYQFLHHFPSLASILPEIERVTAPGGRFFFDEEPVGARCRVRLYRQHRRRTKARPGPLGKLIRFVEGLISEPWCEEVEHGIIENHEIRLTEYRQELARFDPVEAEVRTLRLLRSRLARSPRLANLPNDLLGGVMRALCTRTGGSSTPGSADPIDW